MDRISDHEGPFETVDESPRIVLLNAKFRLIKVCSVSEGTLNESLAHPREVFKHAIVHSAYAFVLVHNLWVAAHKLYTEVLRDLHQCCYALVAQSFAFDALRKTFRELGI
jgi:hypothetical protein